jgi:hypothetical protein
MFSLFTDTELDTLLQGHIDTLRDMLDNHPMQELLAMLCVVSVTPDMTAKQSIVPFPMDENRHENMRALGTQFVIEEGVVPIAVWLISEAWSVTYEQGKIPTDDPMPRDHPDRREIITIQGLAVDGRTNGIAWYTARRDDGTIYLGETHAESWLAQGKCDTDNQAMILEHFFKGVQEGVAMIIGDIGIVQ